MLGVLLIPALLAGCATQAYSFGQARVESGSSPAQGVAGSADKAGAGQPSVSFKLKTLLTAGRMAFVWVDGGLVGQVSPDLQVKPGDVVEIVLVNGDGLQEAQLAIDALEIRSAAVSQKDEQTSLVFTAKQEGVYAYTGLSKDGAQSGVEGRLIVGQPPADQAVIDTCSSASGTMAHTVDASQPTVSFKLATGFADGHMAFLGVDGDLKDKANPDLVV